MKTIKFEKGHITWNKGKKILLSEEHKQNIRNAIEKRIGIPRSEETKLKISKANKGRKFSDEIRLKFSIIHKGKMTGEAHPMWGKHSSEETKRKISLHHADFRGEKHPLWGTHPSQETIEKQKQNRKPLCGEKNPNWTGGRRLSSARDRAIRKRELGFIPLNGWEATTKGFVGHHIDKEHVLYIPLDLHKTTKHKQKDEQSMKKINQIAISWYIEYYGLLDSIPTIGEDVILWTSSKT